jgi:hypothetical protein
MREVHNHESVPLPSVQVDQAVLMKARKDLSFLLLGFKVIPLAQCCRGGSQSHKSKVELSL